MVDPLAITPTPLSVTLTVSTDAQLRELRSAWLEIIAGGLPRTEALEHDRSLVRSKALFALRLIEHSIRSHVGTGQSGRLVHFLAGMYNGRHYPVDITDLRSLDVPLANACLDYLNYDRLAEQEIHHHIRGGADELNRWIRDYRLRARRR